MTTFDDRQKAFEDKFKHDQDLQFRVTNRRNKLLGLWVAEHFGMTGEAADAYAKEVVMADFELPGDEDVVHKILTDFQSRGIEMSEHRIRRHMEECLAKAKVQVMTE